MHTRAQVLFQGFYTTVFGWYEALVFLRTGNLAAPVAVHAFCNWMGVPEFGRMARQRGMLALTAIGVGLFVSVFPTAMDLMTPALDSEGR
jgi:prenyl protein peptidase